MSPALPRLNSRTQNDAELARALQEQDDQAMAREMHGDAARARRDQEARDAALAQQLSRQSSGPALQGRVVASAPPADAAAAQATCRAGCSLRAFVASPNQRVCCDSCGQRIAAGRRTLSCLEHDFDLCETCAASALPSAQATPLPPAVPRQAAGGPVQGRIIARRPSESHQGVDSGMVLVETRLGNANVEMMVDSGAQHSVISLPLARALGLMDRLDRSEQGIAAGVGRARILGKLRSVAVFLGDGAVEYAMDFSVLEVQDQLLLLGLDQLRRFKCIIDLEQNCLIFGGSGGVKVNFLPHERVQRYRARAPPELGCRTM